MTEEKKCNELGQIVERVYFTNFKSMVQMYIRWEVPKKVRIEEKEMCIRDRYEQGTGGRIYRHSVTDQNKFTFILHKKAYEFYIE